MKCKEIMTGNPVHCVPSITVQEAAALMKTHDVGSIPVVKDAGDPRLLGILTDRDLAVGVVAGKRDPDSVTVGEVMTEDPATAGPDQDIDRALKVMTDRKIRRIPLVDPDHRLVGIISQGDLVRAEESPERLLGFVRAVSSPQGGEDARPGRGGSRTVDSKEAGR